MISTLKIKLISLSEAAHRRIFGHEMSGTMREFLGHLSWSFFGVEMKEKGPNRRSITCSADGDSFESSAVDRIPKDATIKLLKPPVLTLWAWRGFIFQTQK